VQFKLRGTNDVQEAWVQELKSVQVGKAQLEGNCAGLCTKAHSTGRFKQQRPNVESGSQKSRVMKNSALLALFWHHSAVPAPFTVALMWVRGGAAWACNRHANRNPVSDFQSPEYPPCAEGRGTAELHPAPQARNCGTGRGTGRGTAELATELRNLLRGTAE